MDQITELKQNDVLTSDIGEIIIIGIIPNYYNEGETCIQSKFTTSPTIFKDEYNDFMKFMFEINAKKITNKETNK